MSGTYLLIAFLLLAILGSSIAVKEGYQSLTNCLDQGYPRDFCMQTPIQSVIDDGYCECGNGQLGTYRTENKCYCYPFNPTFPYYTEKVFRDYLA